MAAVASGPAHQDNAFHELWSFPPMFTIQRHVDVRERQLSGWEARILTNHRDRREHVLEVGGGGGAPYFANKAIDRALSKQDIETILDHLVETGHGEWLDEPVRSQFLVMWDTAQQMSNDIYAWAQDTGKVGEIYTVYDIHSEDDSGGRGFHGRTRAPSSKHSPNCRRAQRRRYRDDGKTLDDWVKFLP